MRRAGRTRRKTAVAPYDHSTIVSSVVPSCGGAGTRYEYAHAPAYSEAEMLNSECPTANGGPGPSGGPRYRRGSK